MPLRFVLVAAVLLSSLAVRAAGTLPQVFACGKEGVAGGLGAGTDLARHTIDLAKFPAAVCNDGTPAVFYYAAASSAADRDKWVIYLQGGGSCVDGKSCAQRWCSIDTNYGLDKMSTSLAKPSIRGVGFMSPDARNRFGTWNRVLIYYCSSDAWAGTTVRTLQAEGNGTAPRSYDIHFKGSRIVDAVLDTLRYATPAKRRRAVSHGSREAVAPQTAGAWPDLDEATDVLFAGSSAGGAGVRANLDRVGTKLRAANPDVRFGGLMDAIYGTLTESVDFTKTTYCANDPSRGCTYEAFTRAQRDAIRIGLYAAREDDSCEQWHAANAPGTEWRCADGEHVTLHHITTPLFLRMDMQDPNIGGSFVAAGLGTPADFATRMESEMRNLPVPEEPRGAVMGQFIPQCMHHESFKDNEAVFLVRINGTNWHDTLWNWWNLAQPSRLIRTFSGTPGAAPDCP